MSQILQPYKVPITYGDLSQAETLKDVFFALENLSGTIDDIFNRMDKRIQDERKRVDHIRTRVATCKGKVDLVKGSNQATTVFSTAKFPAPKLLPAYPTLFSQLTEVRLLLTFIRNRLSWCFSSFFDFSVGTHIEMSMMIYNMSQQILISHRWVIRS